MTMWRATVLDERGRTYELANGTVTIGRDATCTIVLTHPSVSRTHVVLHVDGAIVTATDEGSTHGSSVGGVPLRPTQARRVVSGSELRVGSVPLRIERVHERPNAANTRELALDMVDADTGAPAIVVVEGPDVGKWTPLREVMTVGRDPKCALSLTDPSVSLEHLEVSFDGREVTVRDRDSKHGASLGPGALVPMQPTPWPADRCLVIGQTVLALEHVPQERHVEVVSRVPEAAVREPDEARVEPAPSPKVSAPKPGSTRPAAVVVLLVTILIASMASLVWFLWPHS